MIIVLSKSLLKSILSYGWGELVLFVVSDWCSFLWIIYDEPRVFGNNGLLLCMCPLAAIPAIQDCYSYFILL